VTQQPASTTQPAAQANTASDITRGTVTASGRRVVKPHRLQDYVTCKLGNCAIVATAEAITVWLFVVLTALL